MLFSRSFKVVPFDLLCFPPSWWWCAFSQTFMLCFEESEGPSLLLKELPDPIRSKILFVACTFASGNCLFALLLPKRECLGSTFGFCFCWHVWTVKLSRDLVAGREE